MDYAIRPYHPSDLPTLYRICLQTGANGQDATPLYRDPELLAHYSAGPYAVFEPALCSILTLRGASCGYVLATSDSTLFAQHCEQEWFPVLRERYSLPPDDDHTPDAQMIRLIHAGQRANPEMAAYPAHLHIDLLPQAQGQGWGRALIETLLAQLRDLHVSGIHLGVSTANLGAIGFYERVGFGRVLEYPSWIAFGMRL